MSRQNSILLCLAVSFGASAAAHTIRVPEDISTIQMALSALQENDTVLVALGTYAEALVAPPLSFVLRGDVVPDTGDYPRPLIDPSTLPGSDTLTCLTLPEGSHPIVEDMAFRNGPEMYPNFGVGGIRSRALDPIIRRVVMDSVMFAIQHFQFDTVSQLTLEECRFTNLAVNGVQTANTVVATNCYFAQNQAILLQCGAHSRITDCHFKAVQRPSDYMLVINGQEAQVRNCLFEASANMVSSALHVIFGGFSFVGEPVEITGCGFVGLHGTSGYCSPVTIDFNGSQSVPVIMTDNFFVGNSISMDSLSGAIYCDEVQDIDAEVSAFISDNLFAQCAAPPSGSNAIRLCNGAEIVRNRFLYLDSSSAPAIRDVTGHEANGLVTVRDNVFVDTRLALQNEDIFEIDAEWNWWGDSTGPYHGELNPGGQGDTIVGNVDFDPWYPDTSFLAVSGINKPLPEQFGLEAYPNPFNSTVTLKLSPPEVMIVQVELFDILGHRVKEIWSGPLAFQEQINFDGSDLASGIYFARVWQPIGNRQLALTKLALVK